MRHAGNIAVTDTQWRLGRPIVPLCRDDRRRNDMALNDISGATQLQTPMRALPTMTELSAITGSSRLTH